MSKYEPVPLCTACWYDLHKHEPVRTRNEELCKCVRCGAPTYSGIWVRMQIEVIPPNEQ